VAGQSDTPPTIPPAVRDAAKRILEALDAGDLDTIRKEAAALATAPDREHFPATRQ